jgi:2-methylisocitrate lyase-like PEP mutase family enzyme
MISNSTTTKSSEQQISKASAFGALHTPGKPLILYNVWDCGSAKAVSEAGARALATGSWSVAAAQGYADGQQLPLERLLELVRQMTAQATLPLSVDFEGGYAHDAADVAQNVAALIDCGAVGINFEDQMVGKSGLYSVQAQCERLAAIAAIAKIKALPLFINARTDIFLKATDPATHAGLLDQAVERCVAYQEAGASGFFAPGLKDPDLIGALCQRSKLPVNIMTGPNGLANAKLAQLGVSRISYGPNSYRALMQNLQETARAIFTLA